MKNSKTLGQYILTYGLPALGLGMLLFAVIRVMTHTERPAQELTVIPYESPYQQKVAGLGVVEPSSELVSIAPSIGGVVTQVPVTENSKINKGDLLFQIDAREAEAQLKVVQAALQNAKANLNDAHDQFKRVKNIGMKNAISAEEFDGRKFAYEKAQATYAQAQADVDRVLTTLDLLQVTSPIDGEVLQVNIREGEFASTGPLSTPLMVIGSTKIMHVRVEIDETDTLRFNENAPAKGSLRGYPDSEVQLTFVRKDPLLIPKRSLTGDGNERVDTRVMQVIYAYAHKDLPSYAGQLMDVYIESEPVGVMANNTGEELSQ